MISRSVSARFWPILLLLKLGGNDHSRCPAAIETRTDPYTSHRVTLTFSAMIGHHEADFPLDHAHAMRMAEARWN